MSQLQISVKMADTKGPVDPLIDEIIDPDLYLFGDSTGLSNPKGTNKGQTGIDRGARTVTADGAHHCLTNPSPGRNKIFSNGHGGAVDVALLFFFSL
jgi:hypothetical protein